MCTEEKLNVLKNMKILVNPIDYYHKDENKKAKVGLLPNELKYKNYLNSPLKFPNFSLEGTISEPENIEHNMESLLDYIRQKGWPKSPKPHFVTNRQLLASIISLNTLTVCVFLHGGVIYMIRTDKEEPIKRTFGMINEMHITENVDQNGKKINGFDCKGVFEAKFLKEDEEAFTVLYSAQIDAIGIKPDKKLIHYELKVISRGINNLQNWEKNSCRFFWQSVFGGAESLIISNRTGNYRLGNIPKNTVHSINEFPRSEILVKVQTLKPEFQWTVQEGKEKIYEFLKLVKTKVKEEGDYLVFSKTSGKEWKFQCENGSKREDGSIFFPDIVRDNVLI